ncbi:myc box-dependent-interacting protein 1-like protein [Sarcoptes scabiei]|uniref:Myc box-dependent-interacting protein 1-like protein n=1 Tax=Sarcoptes scabiei TaxID=52283 RepID=A0A132ABX7_SARSC|nr:myc box-dependent-interacting protein 1-like protein [Sarcoptes scabiei]
MSDSKASGFSKVVQKHSLRAKERFLQNFGKKDRTTDELFEIYQSNFNKQQSSASRLLKELKNYATCAREMQTASKSLLECLTDIYEHDWPGQNSIPDRIKCIEILWGDLCHKINDQCTIPLSTYLSQFSEIRNKIDKRGRKLLDYDASRHNHETLQAASKKRTDLKLTKAREQMDEARRLYEVLNKELHEELPALYDSRVPFYINMFQTFFNSETHFHQEYSKVDHKLAEMIEHLAAEAAKGTFQSDAGRYLSQIQQHQQLQLPLQNSPYIPGKSENQISNPNLSNDYSITNSPCAINIDSNIAVASGDLDLNQTPTQNVADSIEYLKMNNQDLSSGPSHGKNEDDRLKQSNGTCEAEVKATYKYSAEDNDELSFESGETLHVIQYEDPEEQEEGWLMGIREITGEKGLFPANFTRPI